MLRFRPRSLSYFLCVLFGSICTAGQTFATPVPAPAVAQGPVQVWVNTASGVYHCPGTRWYGATKSGKYYSETTARAQGFRPAYGRVCQPIPTSEAGKTPTLKTTVPNPAPKVWVNTNSGVYHCPGTRYYGNTSKGKYMTEADAQAAGSRPAYGRSCS